MVYLDEDLIRAWRCRECGNFVPKGEAFERKDDGVHMTCRCLDCSTKEEQNA